MNRRRFMYYTFLIGAGSLLPSCKSATEPNRNAFGGNNLMITADPADNCSIKALETQKEYTGVLIKTPLVNDSLSVDSNINIPRGYKKILMIDADSSSFGPFINTDDKELLAYKINRPLHDNDFDGICFSCRWNFMHEGGIAIGPGVVKKLKHAINDDYSLVIRLPSPYTADEGGIAPHGLVNYKELQEAGTNKLIVTTYNLNKADERFVDVNTFERQMEGLAGHGVDFDDVIIDLPTMVKAQLGLWRSFVIKYDMKQLTNVGYEINLDSSGRGTATKNGKSITIYAMPPDQAYAFKTIADSYGTNGFSLTNGGSRTDEVFGKIGY